MVMVLTVLGLVLLFAAAGELGKRSVARSPERPEQVGEATPTAPDPDQSPDTTADDESETAP